MLVELTEGEIIFIREAAREFRSAAPERIVSDPARLERWREERSLYDADRSSVDSKMTTILASIFDDKNQVAKKPTQRP